MTVYRRMLGSGGSAPPLSAVYGARIISGCREYPVVSGKRTDRARMFGNAGDESCTRYGSVPAFTVIIIMPPPDVKQRRNCGKTVAVLFKGVQKGYNSSRTGERAVTHMKRTIYIADDEENIRNLMKLFLINGGYEVRVFANGDDLLRAFAEKPCDLVVLDIMMPGLDGLSLCTRIRQCSSAFIIIVSARDSELDRITGITLGSDDYLTKPFSPMELVARVGALFRRSELTSADSPLEKLRYGNFALDISARHAEVNGKQVELSPTEFEFILYLLKNRGRAVSREEFLKNVWKFDFEADTRATDDVVKRLRRKLEAAEAELHIESVWGYGFRLNGEDTDEKK